MPFTSPAFALLLTIALSLYYLRASQRYQHTILFAASFAFYLFAGIRDLTVLLATVFVNYWLSLRSNARRRLSVAVAFNLAVLAFFKYRVFLLHAIMGTSTPRTAVDRIPLGISFYIFQLISYQVEVARGRVAPERSFWRVLLYVLFFPHHQAGPIMRPQDFLPQFRGPKFLDLDLIASGVRWCLWGLVQKVAADRLAMRVDPLFDGTPVTVVAAWTGAVAFSIQIYLDFAGYSNIAVGLGYLFGYRMDRNFNQPYAAVDASDFWSRWHITLSTWLRDYLYIPLGGNRGTRAATFRNLMITMTLGGLWHGASWNFVLWGVLHGVLLCGFRARPIAPWSRLASRAILLLSVVALWVPFRARTLTATATMWRAMTGFGAARGAWHQWLELALLCAVFGAIHAMENVILGTPERQRRALQMWQKVPSMARGTVAAAVLFACNLALVDGTTFIYFRF